MSKGMAYMDPKPLKDEWLTPPEITTELGPFDLDPCSPINRPWATAKKHLTENDNGLLHPWSGFVWCNPPYGKQTKVWLERMALHSNGIALIFARTETDMFFRFVWEQASAVLFLRGRLKFYHVDGTQAESDGGAPSVLVAYGPEAAYRLKECNLKGQFIINHYESSLHRTPNRRRRSEKYQRSSKNRQVHKSQRAGGNSLRSILGRLSSFGRPSP